MIQAINKPKQSTVNNSLEQKILSQMRSLKQSKQEKPHHGHLHMNKQQEEEAEKLFDEINIENECNSNQYSEMENDIRQQDEEKQQESFQKQNTGKLQQQQMNQKMANKIKSILKNNVVERKDTKKVTFEGISEKKSKQQMGEKDFVLLQQNRKWGQKLKNPRKGKFDPQERRALIKSLSQCLNLFNMNYEEIVKAMSDEDDEKIPRNLNFWTKVCSVLTDRSVMSSYKFLKRELSTKNKGGEWTEDQVTKLQLLINQYGRKWSLIAKQMNRTAQNIRDKYRLMGQQKYDPSKAQTVWKFQQLVKYLKKLQKYSSTDFLDENIDKQLEQAEKHDQIQMKQMKHRKYNSKTFIFHNNQVVRKYIKKQFNGIKIDEVNWQKLSDRLENKTIFDCRNKFIQLLQLEICGMESKEYFEKEIIKFVANQKAKQQSQINWSKWNNKDMQSEQAKNRWMILKRHIQGRGQKTFAQLLKLMMAKANQE